MTIDVLDAYENRSWSAFGIGLYRPGEGSFVFRGASYVPDQVPVIFGHGGGGKASELRLPGAYVDDYRAICGSSGMPILAGDLGAPSYGGHTWGNDDSIDAVNDFLTWAGNETGLESRSDLVSLYGVSHGASTVLNWAWRNPSKVASIVLTVPAVNLVNVYADNVSLQAPMDFAYVNHTGFLAAMPTHDPAQNTNLIAPFGHKIKIWYAENDEFIRPEDVEQFAVQTGATLTPADPGGHDWAFRLPEDEVAYWLMSQTRLTEAA